MGSDAAARRSSQRKNTLSRGPEVLTARPLSLLKIPPPPGKPGDFIIHFCWSSRGSADGVHRKVCTTLEGPSEDRFNYFMDIKPGQKEKRNHCKVNLVRRALKAAVATLPRKWRVRRSSILLRGGAKAAVAMLPKVAHDAVSRTDLSRKSDENELGRFSTYLPARRRTVVWLL